VPEGLAKDFEIFYCLNDINGSLKALFNQHVHNQELISEYLVNQGAFYGLAHVLATQSNKF
jgi:hypothetical protein